MISYNSSSYGGGGPLIGGVQDDIVFNGFGLQNEFIKLSSYSEDDILDVRTYNKPLSNGRGLLGYYLRGDTIKYNVTIKGVDKEDFQNRLDEMRGALFSGEHFLDIKINGVIRRVRAICTSNPKNFNHYNVNFLETSITFETLEGYNYNINYQTSSFLNKTTGFSEQIINQGQGITDLTIYLLFKTGLSGVDTISIQIGDKTLTINETISDNSALVINGENANIKLNDVEIDYNGEFPLLNRGSNFINFDINGDYEVDINVLNKITYV